MGRSAVRGFQEIFPNDMWRWLHVVLHFLAYGLVPLHVSFLPR